MKRTLLTIFLTTSLFADTGVITKIVDGDTVHFKTNGKKINCRLAYIDTPESKRNKRAKRVAEKCGIELDEMISSGNVAATYTQKHLIKYEKYRYEIIDEDKRYGRAVCEIYLDDDVLFNLQIVKDGYATPYLTYIKNKSTKKQFLEALTFAKDNKTGLWHKDIQTMQCLTGDEITSDSSNKLKNSILDVIDQGKSFYNKYIK